MPITTSAVGGALVGASALLFARQGWLAWYPLALALLGALAATVLVSLVRRRS